MCRVTVYVLMLVIATTSCGQSGTQPQSEWETFPTTVGSTWVYEWTDHLRSETDTVLVTVTGTRDVPPWGSAKVLVTQHKSWSDTMYVVSTADTVRFIPGRYLGFGRATFVLPLQVGARWSIGFVDSSWVAQGGPVSVPAGVFHEAFLVEQRYGPIFNSFLSANTWVVQGVGIVREDRREYDLGPIADYGRKLLAYNIADP
mgnify:CR=1 FL=1